MDMTGDLSRINLFDGPWSIFLPSVEDHLFTITMIELYGRNGCNSTEHSGPLLLSGIKATWK